MTSGDRRWIIPVLAGAAVLLGAAALTVALTLGSGGGSAEGDDSASSTASLSQAERQCQETVTRWVDDIAANQAAFGQAAFEST